MRFFNEPKDGEEGDSPAQNAASIKPDGVRNKNAASLDGRTSRLIAVFAAGCAIGDESIMAGRKIIISARWCVKMKLNFTSKLLLGRV